jgi:hypothetical protein
VEAVERQENPSKRTEKRIDKIQPWNCYQKRIKITSRAEIEWPSLTMIRIPDDLIISGGKFEVNEL